MQNESDLFIMKSQLKINKPLKTIESYQQIKDDKSKLQ